MHNATVEQTIAGCDAVYRHYRDLDAGHFDRVVAQIAPDASIERGPGVFVEGPEGMRRSMDARNPLRSTAHIPGAPIVEALSTNRIRVTYTITAWVRPRNPDGQIGFEVDSSCLLGIVNSVDELVKIGDSWLFAHRRYSAALQ